MMRNARHAKILEIISKNEIETQDELCRELNALGYDVTQATISRDIKELRLFKVTGVTKKYRYTYIDDNLGAISPKMKKLFRESVISIIPVNNLVVIKTLAGNGNNAGMIVDKTDIPEVIGSVAGDDTLLIITATAADAQAVIDRLNEYLH